MAMIITINNSYIKSWCDRFSNLNLAARMELVRLSATETSFLELSCSTDSL